MSINKYLAEAIGTFILVFLGSMSVLAAIATDSPIMVAVPLGFGLGLMAAIFAVGHVSGGHFNPAVTLAMWLDKRTSSSDLIGYWIGQFVGGIIASAVVLAATDRDGVRVTVNVSPEGAGVGLLMEFVLTLIFVLVILASTKKAPAMAGLVIPFTLAVVHLAGIPFSGASVNPARSFGPALVGGTLNEVWIYLVAPLAGAAVAWVFWRMFGGDEAVV
ncbi:MAG: aquaporin [Actinobacteria bacterium]|nr:aquaporin [Actinomycetota bacterium]